MAFLGFGKKEEQEKKTDSTSEVVKTDKKTEKKEEKKEAPKKNVKPVVKKVTGSFNPGAIILGPRITEKGAVLAEDQNAYTFNIHKSANKIQVKRAIEEIYKVSPVKINILQVADKSVFRRGKKGVKSGGKKAVVYLKEGDKIEFV